MLQYLVRCFPRECIPQIIETPDLFYNNGLWNMIWSQHVRNPEMPHVRHATCEAFRLGVERRVWLGGPVSAK